MKKYKQILEAIQKGLNFALNDLNLEDNEGEFSLSKQLYKSKSMKQEFIENSMFVDLGLPSGTLWSKYNLGVNPAKLDSDRDWYGNYYAWGETIPRSIFNVQSYKWFDKNGKLLRYNVYRHDGKMDGKIRLMSEDDAAYVNAPKIEGYTAQIPDFKDLGELSQYTTHMSVRDYNDIPELNGELITSKINGNKIFLPYSGMKYVGCTNHTGFDNNYWTICSTQFKKAYYFGFDRLDDYDICNIYGSKDISEMISRIPANERWKGLSIRAIYRKNE